MTPRGSLGRQTGAAAVAFTTFTMLLTLSVVALTCTGCGTSAAPAPPPRAAGIVLDTPENAVRSLVTLLRAQLSAVAAGDQTGAAAARDQVAWHVAARAELLASIPRLAAKSPADQAAILNRMVETWAASIAYYAQTLDVDAVSVEPPLPGASKRVLRVPALSPDGNKRLRVDCTQDVRTKEWHVQRIEVRPWEESPAAAPASRPGTAPSATPTSERTHP